MVVGIGDMHDDITCVGLRLLMASLNHCPIGKVLVLLTS